jgi:hypothetical protein
MVGRTGWLRRIVGRSASMTEGNALGVISVRLSWRSGQRSAAIANSEEETVNATRSIYLHSHA